MYIYKYVYVYVYMYMSYKVRRSFGVLDLPGVPTNAGPALFQPRAIKSLINGVYLSSFKLTAFFCSIPASRDTATRDDDRKRGRDH